MDFSSKGKCQCRNKFEPPNFRELAFAIFILLLRLDRIRQLEALVLSFDSDLTFDLAASGAPASVLREKSLAPCLHLSVPVAVVAWWFQFHLVERMGPPADGGLLVRLEAVGWLDMCQHFAIWDEPLEIVEPPIRRGKLAT